MAALGLMRVVHDWDITTDGAPSSVEAPLVEIAYPRVAIELEIRDHAGTLLERLVPFRDQLPHNGLTPSEPAAMYLGGLAAVLGRYDDAEEYFAEAADLTRGRMRFAEAHTNLLKGRMLRTRARPGDADRARELLEQARSVAAESGYAMVESSGGC